MCAAAFALGHFIGYHETFKKPHTDQNEKHISKRLSHPIGGTIVNDKKRFCQKLK